MVIQCTAHECIKEVCYDDDSNHHKDDQNAGAPLLWWQAERAGVAQPREQKILGRLYRRPLQYLKGPKTKLESDLE